MLTSYIINNNLTMSQIKNIIVPIKGMHCRSCELLIEEKLKEIPKIKSADLNHNTGQAKIEYYGESINMDNIHKAVKEAGYEVGYQEALPILSKDKREYVSLGVAFLILTILYLVLKMFGLTDMNVNSDMENAGVGLILVVGLVAGFSTCMALVGGLSLGLSTKFLESHPKATSQERFQPHLFFVGGRILSYTLLGGLLGVIGSAIQLSSTANGIITVLVGAVMLLMGLQLINIFPRLSKYKFSLPKGLSKALGIKNTKKEYSHTQALIMGAMTFFLPCGFTQAMQLYAISTGGFLTGAATMGLFAIGTAPGLLSIGGLTSLVKGKFKERFFKVAGLAVIFFGLFNLNNGYTLASLNFSGFGGSAIKNSQAIEDPNVTLENGVQIVRMTEVSRGYTPNSFSIKKGVPVKWIIDAQAPYSCASSLIVPKLNIEVNLEAGENIIEFTPTEAGKLPFSCSMGMYTGVFNVYDDDASQAKSANKTATKTPVKSSGGTCGSASGGGCGCGGGGAAPKASPDSTPVSAVSDGGQQVIKSTYTASSYLEPNSFKVKAGKKVRFDIDVKDNGRGCGYAIMIPELYDEAIPLKAGKIITMEFTPTEKGTYNITCGMDMINYGKIIVE